MYNLINIDVLEEYDSLLKSAASLWKKSTTYTLNNIVHYRGHWLKCTTAGTSGTSTLNFANISNNTLTDGTVTWTVVDPFQPSSSISMWVTGKSYVQGDLVINNNKIYSCSIAHTSTTFSSDFSNWVEISASISHIDDWVASASYIQGDLVAHDAKIYRCTNTHTSGSTWDSTEEAKWEELSPTINEISNWAASTDYIVGQFVLYNDELYKCETAHTSSLSFDYTKFIQLTYKIATTTQTTQGVFGV